MPVCIRRIVQVKMFFRNRNSTRMAIILAMNSFSIVKDKIAMISIKNVCEYRWYHINGRTPDR